MLRCLHPTAGPPVRLSAQHFLYLRPDPLQHREDVGHQVLCGLLSRLLVRQTPSDHGVHLAPLADQPVELGRYARGRLRVGAGLVQHIDGLVGAGAVGDEPVGEDDRGLERVVRDGDGMVALEAGPPGDEHFPRLNRVELFHLDGLESALERGITADPLVVLAARGRADDPDVTPHQGGLQHVGRIHGGAERGALSDEVVQLVDEQDQVRVGGQLADQLADALLVLTAERGARQERDVVERDHADVLQGRRDIPRRNPLSEPFDDRGLPHAGLPDQGGIVLALTQQDIHHPCDLGVTTAHRFQVAAPRLRGEIHAHALEHLARVEQSFERITHSGQAAPRNRRYQS